MWKPGTQYSLISYNNGTLDLFGLSFDFTQNNKDKQFPIPQIKIVAFNEKNIVESVKFNDIDVFKKPLYLKNMQIIEDTLRDIVNEYINKKRFFENKISGSFTSMLSIIARFALRFIVTFSLSCSIV